MPATSARSAFHEQRQALAKASATYDSLVADGADGSALAAAEHQMFLASKALTMQLTPPGVFVLDLVFHVGFLLCPSNDQLTGGEGYDSLDNRHCQSLERLRYH